MDEIATSGGKGGIRGNVVMVALTGDVFPVVVFKSCCCCTTAASANAPRESNEFVDAVSGKFGGGSGGFEAVEGLTFGDSAGASSCDSLDNMKIGNEWPKWYRLVD